ncbi:MAG: YicC family protein [Desulfosarcina sp.]|nr:YicC family protein [Desulfobacterales bacterium]
MIKSMTGFADCKMELNDISAFVEIRSYNSKHLDIALRTSYLYRSFEGKIKDLVSNKITRGRIEINLRVVNASENIYAFDVNTGKAKSYHAALVKLKSLLDLPGQISLELLIGAGEMIKPAEVETDMAEEWILIDKAVNQALLDIDIMRQREGNFIAADFKKRLQYLRDSIDKIENESSELILFYQERLKERIAFLTKGVVEIDPGRIAQEASFLADKSDISEEIVRANSHIEQFITIMNSDEPAGRKLNFLLQEFNREFNTMGSKAGNTKVSHIIVEVKSELEKLREQVQNVE